MRADVADTSRKDLGYQNGVDVGREAGIAEGRSLERYAIVSWLTRQASRGGDMATWSAAAYLIHRGEHDDACGTCGHSLDDEHFLFNDAGLLTVRPEEAVASRCQVCGCTEGRLPQISERCRYVYPSGPCAFDLAAHVELGHAFVSPAAAPVTEGGRGGDGG